MAKKTKENDVDGESLQHSGDRTAEQSAGPVARIETQAQAIELVKSEYADTKGLSEVIIVTEDKNAFLLSQEGSAVNHALKNNLKLFRVSWQDLVE